MNRDLLKSRLGKLPHLPPLSAETSTTTTTEEDAEDDETEELLDSFPTSSSDKLSSTRPR